MRSLILVILTAVWHDWVEGVFGFDPDRHNGSLEWELVAVCCVIAIVGSVLARREWRHATVATAD